MATISALINTRNEEDNIALCLECLTWCDEIVLVDMESEDRTVEIARAYTDKIFNHPKVPAFDIARKMALEKATSDWVLLIDADELVSPGLRAEIELCIAQDLADYVYVPRKTFMFGRWYSTMRLWPDYAAKLFKRSKVSFSEQIHDFTHPVPGARIGYLPADPMIALLHYTTLTVEGFVEKINRYTTVEASLAVRMSASAPKVIYLFLREFLVRYIVRRGYREGLGGLFLSLDLAYYKVLIEQKLWLSGATQSRSVAQVYLEEKRRVAALYRSETRPLKSRSSGAETNLGGRARHLSESPEGTGVQR